MILCITDEAAKPGERTFSNIRELRKFAAEVKQHPAGAAVLAKSTVIAPAAMVEMMLNTLNFQPANVKVTGSVPAGLRERLANRPDTLVS